MNEKLGVRILTVSIRQEGNMIRAYAVHAESGKIGGVIASVSLRVCQVNPEIFEQFKAMARDIAKAIVKDVTGMDAVTVDEPVIEPSIPGVVGHA